MYRSPLAAAQTFEAGRCPKTFFSPPDGYSVLRSFIVPRLPECDRVALFEKAFGEMPKKLKKNFGPPHWSHRDINGCNRFKFGVPR